MANSITQLKDGIQELIPIMRQLAQAQQVVEKAQEDLQDTVEKTDNIFFRFQKTIAGEGKGGIAKAFRTINKFGYATIPMYFKLKNQIEVTSIALGKFTDAVTGGKETKSRSVRFFRFLKNQYKEAGKTIDNALNPTQLQESAVLFPELLSGEVKDRGIGKFLFGGVGKGFKDFFTGKNAQALAKIMNKGSEKLQNTTKKFFGQYQKSQKTMKERFKKILTPISKISLFVVKFAIYFSLVLGLIFILLKSKAIQTAFKKIIGAVIEISKFIFKAILGIIGGFQLIYSALFGDGGFAELLEGIGVIIGGIIKIALGLLGILLVSTIGLLGGIIVEFGSFLLSKILDGLGKNAEKIFETTKVLLVMLGIGMAIVGLLFSLPIAIAGVILAGISLILSKISPFANGGVTKQGLSLVGEKGPELVKLPQGSRVYSNSDSKKMVGGNTNNITVNVQGRVGSSDSELRLIAQKVGQMINKEINRTTSSRTGA